MTNIINSISDDVVSLGHAITRIFWEVVDEAQQTRSRLRLRRELTRLAERETEHYEQLGKMGFELLHDGVVLEPTPQTSSVLVEIERLQAEQGRLLHGRDAKILEAATPFSWGRLQRALQAGEWVIHITALPDSSPWCGRRMTGGSPAGLCFGIQRGHSIQPVMPDTVCLPGDFLMILSPAANVSDWDRWILQGSADQAGEAL
jgi:hypothetical protein